MTKKVLIISYYWPPAGGPGVQRWLKFATYLQDFGITPIIYTPENPNYPIIDEALITETPGIQVLKTPISEPYKWASLLSRKKTKTVSRGIISSGRKGILERLLLFVRGNFFIPDARKSWVKPSVKYLTNFLEANKIDAIVTTGPPHSMHLIGLALKAKTGLPWIADFRDPWTTIGYHKQLMLSPAAARKHISLEQQVLNGADHVIVTSPTTKSEFQELTNTAITVITNGYDSALNKVEAAKLDAKFSLAHIGSLLAARNPTVLWQVLSELCNANNSFKDDLQLLFVGHVAPEIKLNMNEFGLLENCKFSGYVSHQEALSYQASSQVLLVIEIDSPETRCIIPGKLFEYFMAGRPILAMGPKNSDIKALVSSTNTGTFFGYGEKSALKTQIASYYQAYKNNALYVKNANIAPYNRKALTKDLADLLNQYI